jgi:phosphotransferase system HPr-like phosphotransfer protein
VLGLDVRCGDAVTLAADGNGAEAALDELEALLSADLEG